MRKLIIFLVAIILISGTIAASYFFIINYTESQNKKEVLETEKAHWNNVSEMQWDAVIQSYAEPFYVIGSYEQRSARDIYAEIEVYYSAMNLTQRLKKLAEIKDVHDWENSRILNYKEANKEFTPEIFQSMNINPYFREGDYIMLSTIFRSGLAKGYESRTAVYRKINNEWKIIASTL